MKANSFLPLYATNLFGTLNDNFLKTLASFTVIGWLPDERTKSIAMGVTAGALVLPYILCSPLANSATLGGRAAEERLPLFQGHRLQQLHLAGMRNGRGGDIRQSVPDNRDDFRQTT